MTEKTNILNISLLELSNFLKSINEPTYRSNQIWQWIWQKGCRDFSSMTNLSKRLRHALDSKYFIQWPRVFTYRSKLDQTVKFILELDDNSLIETVLIPEKDHFTLCISSQVGCPLACTFCSTGKMGFIRNLGTGEILSQILIAQDYIEKTGLDLPLRNIVFMGMGEPLLNWPSVNNALAALHNPKGFNFSYRRITISTVGIPHVLRQSALNQYASLALSLHAPSQELRQRLMPRAASLIHLEDLIRLLKNVPLRSRQRVTIEYILIGGLNDSLSQAKALNRLVSSLRCKVNLIPFNPGRDIPYQAPDQERVLAFEHFLWEKGLTVNLRKSKGEDIQAACGQLRAQHSKENDSHQNAQTKEVM